MKREILYKITFKRHDFTEESERVYATVFYEAYNKGITILKERDAIKRITSIS